MANISSAFGTISFTKEFSEKYGDEVFKWADVFDKESHGEYGISGIETPVESENGGLSIQFFGSGRWSFESTLRDLGIGCAEDYELNGENHHSETYPSSKKLRECLAKEKSDVTVEFTDEESGCEVLYKEKCVLRYKTVDTFDFIEVNTEDFAYTSRNLLNLDCYDGIDLTDQSDKDECVNRLKNEGFTASEISIFMNTVMNEERYSGCLTDCEYDDLRQVLEIAT